MADVVSKKPLTVEMLKSPAARPALEREGPPEFSVMLYRHGFHGRKSVFGM